MKTGDKIEVILFDKDDNWLAQPVYTRWNNAKWYQKLIGKIFPKYKMKFIDYKGFECVLYKGNGTYEINLKDETTD